jgi:transcriptional regulator with XRE-family HTH domain
LARLYKVLYKDVVDARAIRSLRKKLGLTQQAFASVLGFSFVSVNKWENDGSNPTGLSAVLLQLLDSALRLHPANAVIGALRAAGGAPLDVVRTLTALEKPNERPRR